MPPYLGEDFEGDQYLLVYGTLKPNEPRWPAIEHDVEIHSNQIVFGRLGNYKNLFPVFTYEGDDMIEMVLLEVVTPDVEKFFKKVDEIEGHPHFFRRQRMELFIEENPGTGEELFVWPWLYEGRMPELRKAPIHSDVTWESN